MPRASNHNPRVQVASPLSLPQILTGRISYRPPLSFYQYAQGGLPCKLRDEKGPNAGHSTQVIIYDLAEDSLLLPEMLNYDHKQRPGVLAQAQAQVPLAESAALQPISPSRLAAQLRPSVLSGCLRLAPTSAASGPLLA